MKRLKSILSLFLLTLVGTLCAYAQNLTRGDLLTSMDQVAGKQVLVYAPGGVSDDRPAGYMNGTGTVTSTIGASNLYEFEVVNGKTADGHTVYRLKQVSTGLYFADLELYGGYDSSDPGILPDGTADFTLTTSDASEAFEFTSLPFEEGTDDWRADVSGAKQDLSISGFVFARAEKPSDGTLEYLASLSKPFYAPWNDTNAWLIYAVDELHGVEKVSSYLDYYFGNFSADAYPTGTAPGYYKEEVISEVSQVVADANSMIAAGTATDAEADAMCQRLEEAAEKLAHGQNPITEGYYFIRDNRANQAPYRYITTGVWNEIGYMTSASYTVPTPLTADAAPYIWKVSEGTVEGTFTIQNFQTKKYASTTLANISASGTARSWFTTSDAASDWAISPEGTAVKPSFLIYVPGQQTTQWNTDVGFSGGLTTWGNHPEDLGNCFTFEAISEDDLRAIEAEALQNQLNTELTELYEEASAKKSMNDGSLGAVTSDSQLSTNAPCSSEGSLGALIDGDYSTYFHSAWAASEAPTDEDHYIQADLGEAVSSLTLQYAQRLTNINENEPCDVTFEVSNDGQDFSAITTAQLTYPDTVVVDGRKLPIGECTVEFGDAYRYVRMSVQTVVRSTGSVNGHAFWYLSELHFITPNSTTGAYQLVSEAVRAEFEKQLAAAESELAEGKATQATIDALQAAYDALLQELPDVSRVSDALTAARAALGKAEAGTDPGYYPQSAIDAFSAAIASAEAAQKPVMTLDEINTVLNVLSEATATFHAALILPEVGKFYVIRGASEKKNGTAWISRNALVYSNGNEVNNGVRFLPVKDFSNAPEETVDSINYVEGYVNYVWTVEQADASGIVLRNVGTGMYLGNQPANNTGVQQSVTPVVLPVDLGKAGVFTIECGDGLYANAQFDTKYVVTWGDKDDQNGFWRFEEIDPASFSYETDYVWSKLAAGQFQILTLPVTIDGTTADGYIYDFVGLSADNKIVLTEHDGSVEIAAGTPFVYQAADDATSELFTLVDNWSEGLEYATAGTAVNGLQGCLSEGGRADADMAYFRNGNLTATYRNGVDINANSGYFNGQQENGVEVPAGAVTLDLPSSAQLTGIESATVAVLPAQVDVYTTNGVLVRKSVKTSEALKGLPAGLYIVGGQKMLVK